MVICCIGTPKVLGDSIAPRVGDLLLSRDIKAYVYGTTARPITALNYLDYYDYISAKHPNDLIIAVDCALGKKENIGKIKLTTKGVCPGKALDKKLCSIGDIGILGQVGDIAGDPLSELKSTPKDIISTLISDISKIIFDITDFVARYKAQTLDI